MYNSPRHHILIDSTGTVYTEYDKDNNRRTLIDNQTRVYKGGSWRDREYWLDPAQRRYLPEYMSRDDIGFRCAMSKVGSKMQGKKKRKN